MRPSILYANAVISTRMNKMLNSNRARRMMTAPSFSDSAKVLLECGYSERIITFYPDRDDLIVADEFEKTVKIFTELCPDELILHCVLLKFDYHNALAIYKARGKATDLKEALYPFGEIELAKLEKAINSQNYILLPDGLRKALTNLDNMKNPLSLSIDLEIEKALHTEIATCISKIKNKHIKKYFNAEMDLLKVKIFAKCRLYRLPAPTSVVDGNIKKEDLDLIYGADIQKLKSHFAYHHYKELIDIFCNCIESDDLSAFENAMNIYLLKLSRGQKDNYFDLSLIFGWFVTKLEELKVVKLILMGKKFGFSNERIREMMRGVHGKFE